MREGSPREIWLHGFMVPTFVGNVENCPFDHLIRKASGAQRLSDGCATPLETQINNDATAAIALDSFRTARHAARHEPVV